MSSRAPAISKEHQQLATLLTLPENRLCADCNSKQPKWASFSLGYFVCLECSGIHRALGTHITKVSNVVAEFHRCFPICTNKDFFPTSFFNFLLYYFNYISR